MNPSRKYPAKERRYGFACLVCRRRKIRCDGKKPNCENCAKAKETCNYKESSSYNAQLVSQLQRSRKHNNDLKRRLRELASLDPSDRDRRLAETNQELDDLDMMESPPEGMNEAPNPNLTPESDVLNEEMSYHVPDNFSLDENGTYYGATSRFCPLPASEQQMNQHYGLEERKLEASEAYHRKWLASNSKLHQSLENLAMKNIHQYTDVDPDLCEILLQIYWTWQAPLHNCVYRRCFFRDLALGGPYFSPFLLNVMFAHACRHTKDDDTRFFPLNKGEYFLQQARQLLMEELARDTPRICTIQGLLILGGRQCAVGKSSEGWLYTGMAIRMMTDLGIHLYRGNLDKLHGMEPDDLEVRKRLYLSAFIWDKSISLCLGRAPCLTELSYPPDKLFDISDNDFNWTPFYLKEADGSYPLAKSHNTLTFIHFCELAKIINKLYQTVYGKCFQNLKLQSIIELEMELRSFYQKLPDVLRIELTAFDSFCPPPHIFCLNILYHTMLILVFRPFLGLSISSRLQGNTMAARAQQVCTEEATKVNGFFHLYERAFKFQNQTYLVSYCVYTAATIDIQQIRHEDHAIATAAAKRLSTTLKMLESEAQQTPGIKRSIDIIKSHLNQWPEVAARQKTTTCSSGQPSWNSNQILASHRSSTSSGQVANGRNALPSYTGDSLAVGEGQLAANTRTIDLTGLDQPPGYQESQDSIGSLINEAMDVNPPWGDWASFNPSGGFVPEYHDEGWALFDPAVSYFNTD